MAYIVKTLPRGRLEEIYGVTNPMTESESAELKAANEWAWKTPSVDVVKDEDATAAAAAPTTTGESK